MEFTNLRSCLDHFIADYNTPGVDCIVYRDHKMLYRYCGGVKDLESGAQLTEDTLYYIYSMTKMLTCTAALQLLEKGCYRLDDPVSRYLPEFEQMLLSEEAADAQLAITTASGSAAGGAPGKNTMEYGKTPITVWNLFTMTAGLDYNLSTPAIRQAVADGHISTRELVRAIAARPLGFVPGTRFCYSLCHDVLGALIEVWSGLQLGDYMQRFIFTPLGMKNTFFGAPQTEAVRTKLATLYSYDGEGYPQRIEQVCAYNLSEQYQSGGAGLISCPEDYALFLDALACGGSGKNGNQILSANSVERMRTNQLSGQALADFQNMKPGYGYGFGVRVHIDKETSGANSPLGEFGWSGAAGGFSLVDLENKLSVAYFQSVLNWNVRIQNEIKNALYADINALCFDTSEM